MPHPVVLLKEQLQKKIAVRLEVHKSSVRPNTFRNYFCPVSYFRIKLIRLIKLKGSLLKTVYVK
jgi:hypothetical protein